MDTDERFVAKNDYRKAINCRINSIDEDSFGTLENIRSNKNIVNSNFTNGKCIGAYEDLNANVVYYFISGGNTGVDSIFRYDPQTEFIQTVIQDNILNFNTNNLITGINILGDDDDKFPLGLLYWTDDINPPRKINVHKAINNLYPTIDTQTLNAVKYPPNNHLTCIGNSGGFLNDTNITSNQLKGKCWQFKYRWVYDDGEKSSWSPISPIYIDNTFAAFYNISGQTQNLNNTLALKFDSGHHTVERIQISTRNTNGLDDFKLIADIKKDDVTEKILINTTATVNTVPTTGFATTLLDDTDYQFYFYNDAIYSTIDVVESNKLYNDIPHKAKAQEIVEGNRLVYGNVVTGQTVDESLGLSLTAGRPNTPGLTNAVTNNAIPVDYLADMCIGCGMAATGNGQIRRTRATFRVRWLVQPSAQGCFSSYRLVINNLFFSKALAKRQLYTPFVANEDHEANLGVINVNYNSSLYASTMGVNNIAAAIATDLNNYAQMQTNFNQGGQSITGQGAGGNYSVRSIGSNSVDSNWGPNGHTHTQINNLNFSTNGAYIILTIQMSIGAEYRLDATGVCEIESTPGSTSIYMMSTGWTPHTGNCTVSGEANTAAACPHKGDIGFSVGMGYNWINNEGEAGRFAGGWQGNLTDFELEINSTGGPGVNQSMNLNISNGDVGFMQTIGQWVGAIGPALGKFTEGGQGIQATICPAAGQQPIIPSFKTGAKHRFGLVYYDDANRSSSVQLADVADVYIPKNTDVATTTNPAGWNGEWFINWEILHFPPDWATHYQWVYGGNTLTRDFMQFVTDGIYDGVHALKDDMSGNNLSSGTYGDNILVDISNIKQFQQANGGGVVSYDFQEGDILRFVLDQNDNAPNANLTPVPTILLNGQNIPVTGGTPWEFKIVGIVGQKDLPDILPQSFSLTNPNVVTATGNGPFAQQVAGVQDYIVLAREAVLVPFLDSNPTAFPTFRGWTLEIYTPKKKVEEDKVIYYEFGEWGTCVQGRHQAIDDTSNTWAQNQVGNVVGSGAQGRFQSGDVYLRNRVTRSQKMICRMESFHYSDVFKSDFWDKGRPNAVLEDFKRTRKFATCLYSEAYIPNTNINGLNSIFPDVSFQEFERGYNSIQKLHSRDNNLLIFQEDKVSISLVNKKIIYNMDGSGNIASTDSVLSIATPYLGNYGICKNPESFASHGRRIYFADIKRGAVLRLSQDGFTEVSSYRMKDYFTDLSVIILESANLNNYKIYGTFDTKYSEYIVSYDNIAGEQQGGGQLFLTPNIMNYSTIGFSEPTNKWNSFYDFHPEMMCTSGVNIVTFNNGELYHHDRGIDTFGNKEYNKFYQQDVTSQLWVISNIAPSNNKIYKAISTESDEIWSVVIENKQGQQTSIFVSDFDTRENIHYSQIYNDENSPGGMIEGDRMRSVSALIKLSNTSNSLSRLFGVNVNFSSSERSNK